MHISRSLKIGDIQLVWLSGGNFRLDGGAMFGVVPKVLWQKSSPVDSENTIPMCNDPLLIITPQSIILVDTGLGNKLTDKQKSIFRVSGEWNLITQLEAYGIRRDQVKQVVLTHCDFDHAGGLETYHRQGGKELTFPEAVHFIQKKEWEDVLNPHPRAKSTYLEDDFSLLRKSKQLVLIDGDEEISPGVTLRITGGHTRGHQLVEIRSGEQLAVHLGDLFPTHAHSNPLWGMAYDNFPLEVIDRKREFFDHYIPQNSWFTLYHDPFVRACRLDAGYKVKETWPMEQSD
jgi:glyoxylase-like metal-dependent hydrolase (beta-lactamase superfamily II)